MNIFLIFYVKYQNVVVSHIDCSVSYARTKHLAMCALTPIPLDGASAALQNFGKSAVNCSRSGNSEIEISGS